MSLKFLTQLLGSSNTTAVAQTNFEKIDASLAFMLSPSVDGTGLPTINLGPPTAGAHVLNELWTDALGAIFKCTAAGTPGT
ncbi:MAG TPA: hypothetical protein VN516_09980, partial [Candidatus Baltobacteraceae bacterium]|nr:hypothetical protein [Candidatus Baltobacteraceae bacterium]